MGHEKYKKHSVKRKAPLSRFVVKEIKILRGRLTCNEIKGQVPHSKTPHSKASDAKEKWLRVFLLLKTYNTKAIANVQKDLGLIPSGHPRLQSFPHGVSFKD